MPPLSLISMDNRLGLKGNGKEERRWSQECADEMQSGNDIQQKDATLNNYFLLYLTHLMSGAEKHYDYTFSWAPQKRAIISFSLIDLALPSTTYRSIGHADWFRLRWCVCEKGVVHLSKKWAMLLIERAYSRDKTAARQWLAHRQILSPRKGRSQTRKPSISRQLCRQSVRIKSAHSATQQCCALIAHEMTTSVGSLCHTLEGDLPWKVSLLEMKVQLSTVDGLLN